MSSTLSLHEVQINEISAHQSLPDVRTTNGVLVWKVSNFSEHRATAMSARTTSLFSPAFMTSPAGYQLCVRLYPNGDGLGRGTHISLFLVVMKGEFDALLPWPFRQKVTLSMLDQSLADPHHVSETFRPDPSSSSFQRPLQQMNVASGCPLFFPLRSLMQSGCSHLRDDTIYIKITVHTQGLTAPD